MRPLRLHLVRALRLDRSVSPSVDEGISGLGSRLCQPQRQLYRESRSKDAWDSRPERLPELDEPHLCLVVRIGLLRRETAQLELCVSDDSSNFRLVI
jgi:hypothetical protein